MPGPSLTDILKLDVEERLRLVQEIWDTIAEAPDALPVSDAERVELEARLEDLQAHPEAESPWIEVRDRLRRR